MPSVLIIGASGQVGSATLRASLNKGYRSYAFLRTPSKLASALSSDPNCTIVQGDASDANSVRLALKQEPPVEAVIITAPMGDMRGRRSGFEDINHNIIQAIQAEQKESGRKIRVWMMAGQAILEHPLKKGTYLNKLMPFTFYPEYEHTIKFLETEATDVHWTINAPALISKGSPKGPLVESITVPPLWKQPFPWTKYIPLGLAVNTMYNWTSQQITFQSLGEYMINNLSLDDRLEAKRVAVLEDPKGVRS